MSYPKADCGLCGGTGEMASATYDGRPKIRCQCMEISAAVDAAEYRRACKRIAELQDGNDRLLAVQAELRERIAELEQRARRAENRAGHEQLAKEIAHEKVTELEGLSVVGGSVAELERDRDTEAAKARCGERAVAASQKRIAELERERNDAVASYDKALAEAWAVIARQRAALAIVDEMEAERDGLDRAVLGEWTPRLRAALEGQADE